MPTFAFSATVTGLNLEDDSQLDALFHEEIVLVPGEIDGVVSISVEIDADSGETAIATFTRHLNERVPDVTVTRIDEDLVNTSEIAMRLDVNRETVRLWSTGARGEADFPAHRCIVGQQKLWTWAAVYAWAQVCSRLPEDEPQPLDTNCVDWFNGTRIAHASRPSPDVVISHVENVVLSNVSVRTLSVSLQTGSAMWRKLTELHTQIGPFEARDGTVWQAGHTISAVRATGGVTRA